MGGKHIKTEKRNIRFRLKKVSEAKKKRGKEGKNKEDKVLEIDIT